MFIPGLPRPKLSRRPVLLGLLGLLLATGPVHAGSVTLGGAVTGGAETHLAVTSYQALKFRNILKQKEDFSCGSAALATLLTYHYGIAVAEKDVLLDMLEHGDRQRIETQGFSMLDMKDYLARHGLQSGGFRLPLDKIATVRVPGIVLINHNGYHHFVVLEGIENGRVLLADPALGTRAIPVATFQREWNKILFLVMNNADRAQSTFNLAQNWAVQPRASWGEFRGLLDLTRLGWRNAQAF